MNRLKPCPFCGSSLIILYHKTDLPWIQCLECLASTSCGHTEEEAIEAWNRRVDKEVKE